MVEHEPDEEGVHVVLVHVLAAREDVHELALEKKSSTFACVPSPPHLFSMASCRADHMWSTAPRPALYFSQDSFRTARAAASAAAAARACSWRRATSMGSAGFAAMAAQPPAAAGAGSGGRSA